MAPRFLVTFRRRFFALRWRRRRSGSPLALATLPLALFLALPAAPVVAQAAPATTSAASPSPACLLGLLGCKQTSTPSNPAPAASPSNCLLGVVGCGTTPSTSGLCVLGVLLCGNNLVTQPTPCVGGVLLCGPAVGATPCSGGVVLCGGGSLVGPGDTAGQPAGGGSHSGKPSSTSGANAGTSSLPGTTNVSLALGVPPGVGLVPRAGDAGANGTPNPDAFSELLSLSIRDGLSPGGSQFWPGLAMLQAVLLLVIVGAFAARRVLEASKPPRS